MIFTGDKWLGRDRPLTPPGISCGFAATRENDHAGGGSNFSPRHKTPG